MFETIKYETKDGIVLITVNRPQALNALNPQVLDELYKAFEQQRREETCKLFKGV